MAARDQHTQTQEKLQTNGDTKSPKDCNIHLSPLDQKVKDTASKGNQPRLGSLGWLCLTGAATPPPRGDRGLEEKDLT